MEKHDRWEKIFVWILRITIVITCTFSYEGLVADGRNWLMPLLGVIALGLFNYFSIAFLFESLPDSMSGDDEKPKTFLVVLACLVVLAVAAGNTYFGTAAMAGERAVRYHIECVVDEYSGILDRISIRLRREQAILPEVRMWRRQFASFSAMEIQGNDLGDKPGFGKFAKTQRSVSESFESVADAIEKSMREASHLRDTAANQIRGVRELLAPPPDGTSSVLSQDGRGEKQLVAAAETQLSRLNDTLATLATKSAIPELLSVVDNLDKMVVVGEDDRTVGQGVGEKVIRRIVAARDSIKSRLDAMENVGDIKVEHIRLLDRYEAIRRHFWHIVFFVMGVLVCDLGIPIFGLLFLCHTKRGALNAMRGGPAASRAARTAESSQREPPRAAGPNLERLAAILNPRQPERAVDNVAPPDRN